MQNTLSHTIEYQPIHPNLVTSHVFIFTHVLFAVVSFITAAGIAFTFLHTIYNEAGLWCDIAQVLWQIYQSLKNERSFFEDL